MAILRIAIVSDLHVGKGARSKDLTPHTPPEVHQLDEQYIATFTGYLRKHRIHADYLIVPGDATHAAHPNEVTLAASILTKIAEALELRSKRMIFIPGNHDVDWAVQSLGPEKLRKDQRYDPIKSAIEFSSALGKPPDRLFIPPYLQLWKTNDLIIVGYNTSWHDNKEELMHFGRLDNEHYEALKELLEKIGRGVNVPKIFLAHHHPIPYDNPIPGQVDFSQMQNSEKLMRLLYQHEFDIFIHGHLHQPRFQTKSDDGLPQLALLSAGTFSLRLPQEWAKCVSNQFHMIEIQTGQRNQSDRYYGVVKSWSYHHGVGWNPSLLKLDGIASLEPFGNYGSVDEVSATLRPLIASELRRKGYMKLKTALTGKLRYVRPTILLRALDYLTEDLNFEIGNNDPISEITLTEK